VKHGVTLVPGRFTPANGSPSSYTRLLLVLTEEHHAERRAHEDLDGAQGVADTVVVVNGGEGGRATSGGTALGRS
jgi:hypothetical protein